MGKRISVKPLGAVWWLFLFHWVLPCAAIMFTIFSDSVWQSIVALWLAIWINEAIEGRIMQAAAERALGVEEE